ncbi:MAG: phytanoyl-CoA dioxygenase family protein [Myxococcota bacterium]|nr:phytanoyl-CoA dioxygenase family protein [Myxococcota bacterium]
MQIETHERNRGFTWAPPPPPHRRIDATQAEAWSRDGFFVLEDAFDAETLGPLIAAIDPVEQQVADFLETRPDGKLLIAEAGNITFTTHLVQRLPEARAFCHHPVFQDLASDLLGPDVRLYWDQAVYKKPAKPGVFPWHQDNGYTYIEPQQYLTCWVALTDATVENGCPWVVPGLHHHGTLRHWSTDAGFCCLEEPDGAVAVPARAGSIVVFSSLTPHRTGPNTSDAVRKAYIVQFAPAGAIAYRDGADPEPQDDESRQFRILEDGKPV